MEHEAAAIIFDATRYKAAKKSGDKFNYGGLPDFANRNTERQYWVWWPREAASKGISWGLDWSIVGESGWDSCFNLTASYRRDSDVTRTWGTTQEMINQLRWDKKNERIVSFDEHINVLMERKTAEKLASK